MRTGMKLPALKDLKLDLTSCHQPVNDLPINSSIHADVIAMKQVNKLISTFVSSINSSLKYFHLAYFELVRSECTCVQMRLLKCNIATYYRRKQPLLFIAFYKLCPPIVCLPT